MCCICVSFVLFHVFELNSYQAIKKAQKRLLVIVYWFLVTDDVLLVIGYLLLVTVYWLLFWDSMYVEG